MSRKVLAAVKGVILDKDNNFLIIKQQINSRNYTWDIPGGKIEYGENPYKTLIREVKEEVFLDIEIEKPLGMWWFINEKLNSQIVCNTFLCNLRSNNQLIDLTKNPASENLTEFKWVSKKEFLSEEYRANKTLKSLISKIFL